MKQKNALRIGALTIGLFTVTACGSAKNQDQVEEAPRRTEQPSTIELLTEFDIDKDGRISETEAKGPIKDNFLKIDVDKDGFLTVEELKNAPKPEEGKRPEGRPEGRSGGRREGGRTRN